MELNFILYSLQNYEEVKLVYEKLKENKINLNSRFIQDSLVHFIENFDDFEELKIDLQSKYKKIKGTFLIQQILLSKTKKQAAYIIKQAENYGSDLKYWHDKYNSFERIKETQKAWKRSHEESNGKEFFVIFLEFTKNKSEYLNHLSLKQLKKLAENNEDIAELKNSKVTVFPRSFYVKQFAKRAAAGICQLCENYSLFKDKMNEPFLEVHHVNYLSKGGFDNIENVVALCPNCHRKVHLLETREDYNTLLEKALKNLDI